MAQADALEQLLVARVNLAAHRVASAFMVKPEGCAAALPAQTTAISSATRQCLPRFTGSLPREVTAGVDSPIVAADSSSLSSQGMDDIVSGMFCEHLPQSTVSGDYWNVAYGFYGSGNGSLLYDGSLLDGGLSYLTSSGCNVGNVDLGSDSSWLITGGTPRQV